MKKLIKGAMIVEGTGVEPIQRGVLLVNGNKIEAVGHEADFGSIGDGIQVIDLSRWTLVPGFVDTHMHLTGNGTAHAPEDLEFGSREDLLLQAAANAQVALREGVTTFRDCGARNDVIFAVKSAAQRGIIRSPRLLAAGGAITRTGGHGHFFGVEVDSAEEMKKAVRSQVKLGADFIKVMATGGIMFVDAVPGLLYYDLAEMRVVVEEAAKLGRFVASHCLAKEGIEVSVEAGVRTIEHCVFYERSIDVARYDPALGERIARKGIYVNPSNAFAHAAYTDESVANDPTVLHSKQVRLHKARVASVRELIRAGVPIIPGSDAGWYTQPFGDFALMPELMVEELEMAPREAFEACTRVAADAIGLGRQIGTLQPGKLADVVALDGDPTTDAHAMRRVKFTMVDGRVMYQLGQLEPAVAIA